MLGSTAPRLCGLGSSLLLLSPARELFLTVKSCFCVLLCGAVLCWVQESRHQRPKDRKVLGFLSRRLSGGIRVGCPDELARLLPLTLASSITWTPPRRPGFAACRLHPPHGYTLITCGQSPGRVYTLRTWLPRGRWRGYLPS